MKSLFLHPSCNCNPVMNKRSKRQNIFVKYAIKVAELIRCNIFHNFHLPPLIYHHLLLIFLYICWYFSTRKNGNILKLGYAKTWVYITYTYRCVSPSLCVLSLTNARGPLWCVQRRKPLYFLFPLVRYVLFLIRVSITQL